MRTGEADRLLRREQEEAFQEAQREDEEREREKEEREEKMRLGECRSLVCVTTACPVPDSLATEEAVQLSKQLDAEEQLRKAREQLKPEPPHAPHTAAVPTTTLRMYVVAATAPIAGGAFSPHGGVCCSKLPNGEPVKRRFLSTDTIEELRRFLDVTMADRSLDIGAAATLRLLSSSRTISPLRLRAQAATKLPATCLGASSATLRRTHGSPWWYVTASGALEWTDTPLLTLVRSWFTRLRPQEASLHPQAVLFVTAAPESGSDDDDGDASTPATSGGGGGGGSSRT